MKPTRVVLGVCLGGLSLLLAAGSGRAAAPQRPRPLKIYQDESRSLQIGAQTWLHLKGVRISRATDLISLEHLKPYDVAILWNQVESLAYSREELEAIDTYVRNGGGLLLIGRPQAYTKVRAVFANGGFARPEALPVQDFSMNAMAALWGLQFSNATRLGVPHFAASTPLTESPDVAKMAFEQPLSCLVGSTEGAQVVAEAFGHPVVVAKSHGRGRVILCGAPRLFLRYGTLAESKLHETDEELAVQERVLRQWLEWLGEGSPVRSKSPQGLPLRIPGRVRLEEQGLVVYTIPQLESVAKELVGEWAKVWPQLARMTGLASPVELARGSADETLLEIYLCASPGGGLSGGNRIAIPAMGGDERLIAILSHEVGHKLLGGCNHGASEAFAEWCAIKGLTAAGYEKFAAEKLQKKLGAFREADPTGKKMDLSDVTDEISRTHAYQGKWIWIFATLEKEYGETFLAAYLKALRKNVTLVGPAHKQSGGKKVSLTMRDHITAMSEAAGKDLTPWFKELGTSIGE